MRELPHIPARKYSFNIGEVLFFLLAKNGFKKEIKITYTSKYTSPAFVMLITYGCILQKAWPLKNLRIRRVQLTQAQ